MPPEATVANELASDRGLASSAPRATEPGLVENGTYSPFSFHADGGTGELTGYDVDVARAVGEKLGVNVDGVFGPLTESAVMAFQRSHGLVVDGIPGKLTTAALQRAVGATPDSIWGKATTAAIQKKVGAVVDGIPGGETYFKLGVAIEGGKL